MLAPSLSLVAELCCCPLQAVSGPVLPTKDDLNIRLFLLHPFFICLLLVGRCRSLRSRRPSRQPLTSLHLQPVSKYHGPLNQLSSLLWLQLLLLKCREEDKVEVRRLTDVAVEFVLSELDAELKRSCRIKLGTSLAFGFHG